MKRDEYFKNMEVTEFDERIEMKHSIHCCCGIVTILFLLLTIFLIILCKHRVGESLLNIRLIKQDYIKKTIQKWLIDDFERRDWRWEFQPPTIPFKNFNDSGNHITWDQA